MSKSIAIALSIDFDFAGRIAVTRPTPLYAMRVRIRDVTS